MSGPVIRDPSPREFADNAFRAMGAMIADIDARAEQRAAAKAEQRRTRARKARERAALKLPAALNRVIDNLDCKRVNVAGGFHIEAWDPAYRPHPGDLVRLTFTADMQQITATRKPGRGRTETPRPVTAHGAIRLLAEFARSIEQNTPPPYYGPVGCQCASVRNPPCAWCENTAECEVCGEFVHAELLDEHMDDKHASEEMADA